MAVLRFTCRLNIRIIARVIANSSNVSPMYMRSSMITFSARISRPRQAAIAASVASAPNRS